MKNQEKINLGTEVHKQYFLRSVLILFLSLHLSVFWGQDIILLKDGSELNGKVVEINDHDVKYKKHKAPYDPTYIVRKSQVFSVTYSNGSKEVFSTEDSRTTSTFVDPLPEAPDHRSKFDSDTSDFAKKKRKNFSGPRVGVVYIGPGTTTDYLHSEGKRPYLTQFGWQFEARLFTVEDGTSGLVEFVPLIGGIEQGLFLPSASFLLGLRSGSNASWEFAIGPNFGFKSDYKGVVRGAAGLVIAFGTSFKKGNVWFPVNIIFVPSVGSMETVEDENTNVKSEKKFETGFRIGIMAGFNSRRK